MIAGMPLVTNPNLIILNIRSKEADRSAGIPVQRQRITLRPHATCLGISPHAAR